VELVEGTHGLARGTLDVRQRDRREDPEAVGTLRDQPGHEVVGLDDLEALLLPAGKTMTYGAPLCHGGSKPALVWPRSEIGGDGHVSTDR
jgi:hypothetical protein